MRQMPNDMTPGTIHPTNKSGGIKIVDYRGCRRVTIEFLETGEISNADTISIREGSPRPKVPVDMQPGKVYHTRFCGALRIVKYHDSVDVTVRFMATGGIASTRAGLIREGVVRDPSLGRRRE